MFEYLSTVRVHPSFTLVPSIFPSLSSVSYEQLVLQLVKKKEIKMSAIAGLVKRVLEELIKTSRTLCND
jgi:hypothetical protein